MCRQGRKIALFGDSAKQLTEFVAGEFDWEWPDSFHDNLDRICYFNKVAKVKMMATYTKNGEVSYATLPFNSILVKRKPAKCSVCKGQVVPIAYGFPYPETFQKADRKEVVLGGCCIWGNDPDWECIECHTKYIKD